MGRWTLATVAGLVSLTVILILGLSVGGLDVNEQEIIRMYVAAVIPLTASILALAKANEVDSKIKNGFIEKKAVEALKSQDSDLTKAVQNATREGNTNG